MAAPPTLAGNVQLPSPVFLRKLRRKADWGHAGISLDRRVEDAVRQVFLCDPKPYSLFRVETSDNLHWAAIGINGGRPSLTCELYFVAISPEVFRAVGIIPEQSEGDTRCGYANGLHFDFQAEEEQLRDLCRRMMDANRSLVHMTKRLLTPLAEQARAVGCLVVDDSPGCTHERCA